MFDTRDQITVALEETLEAFRTARLALLAAERETRKALRRSGPGVPPTATVLRESPVSQVRRPLDEALRRLERTRHNVLLAYFAAALEDGMSIAELGRNYGFSRQRATRLAKEARAAASSR